MIALGKASGKKANPVCSKMTSMLQGHPCLSITPDRGKEFALHGEDSESLMAPFFPLPHHPWDRGTNENTNGLVREYLPRGCDMDAFTDSEMNWIQNELNTRPLKCLGFRTPHEVFFSETLHLV